MVGHDVKPCLVCRAPTSAGELAEVAWLAPDVIARLECEHPDWKRSDGACPSCVQQTLMQALLARGDAALRDGIQAVWPLDAEAAFGALPRPLRLHADPRYTGWSVTLALVDAAFYPYSDLVQPTNRIRTWVDAAHEPVRTCSFGPGDAPRWP